VIDGKKPFTQPTSAQSLGALLKSARDIMRKDKGLNGDLDCLPSSCRSFGLTGRGIVWWCRSLGLRCASAQALTGRAFSPPVRQGRSAAM